MTMRLIGSKANILLSQYGVILQIVASLEQSAQSLFQDSQFSLYLGSICVKSMLELGL